MGLGSRIFIVNDNGSLRRLSMTKYERLFRQDPNECLPEYAGQRVKYAHIVVELENRKPRKVIMDQFLYLTFDSNGKLDQSAMEKETRLGVEMVAPVLLDLQPANVVDARHRFAQKEFSDRYRWEPSPDIIDAIGQAIFGKNRFYP